MWTGSRRCSAGWAEPQQRDVSDVRCNPTTVSGFVFCCLIGRLKAPPPAVLKLLLKRVYFTVNPSV